MVTRNADSSFHQGDCSFSSAHPVSAEQLRSHAGNTIIGLSASGADNSTLQVFKSGPLLVSSKGIGWTSWKKRWFILTKTSLVFFRSDPSVAPQKGSEANLTLGGIDLNNSASVVVRADKKLLTVLFPGRDGRAFTLKAETSEDMYEWKTALEAALAQAPGGATATLAVEQSGIFLNEAPDAIEGSFEQWRDKRPAKSSIIGRPVLHALEDTDGTPSFLEKALRFIEQYGVKVEGILRQSADVDEVERRVQEYEQGKNEFSPNEDAHLIADCIKHVLRELPSSPIPASCCTSLLEAFRTGRGSRVNAMQDTISKTFPEPNCRLLQRVLKMMRTVVYYKSVNRMSTSAVAACMAPLLLRPLLAGECEVESDFNMGGDGSLQLLRAAAAANHAQAIVITLLEEYGNIFLDGSFSPELYSETEGSGSEYEGSTGDETMEDDGYQDAENDGETEDDPECELSGSCSDDSGDDGSDLYDNEMQVSEDVDSDSKSPKVEKDFKADEKPMEETHDPTPHHQNIQIDEKPAKETHAPTPQHQNIQTTGNLRSLSDNHSTIYTVEHCQPLDGAPKPLDGAPKSTISMLESTSLDPSSCIGKSTTQSNGPLPGAKPRTIWGRTAAKKNLSMESIDFPGEDEIAIQRLENTKVDLENKIAREASENEILQASLERQKQALQEHRLALEQDVARLQDQLQRARDLRETLEAGLKTPLGLLSIPSTVDSKIDQQRQHNYGSVCESCGQRLPTSNHQATPKAQQKDVGATAAEHHPETLPSNEPPQKQQPDSTNQNSTILSPVRENVITQDPLFLSNKQSPKKQQPDSTGTTSNSSSGCENVTMSSSENQAPQKQWPDLTLHLGAKFEGTTMKSSFNQENVTTRDKQPNRKQQPDSPRPNSTKFKWAAASSSPDCTKVIAQNPLSLSDKQLPYNQQLDSTSKNNKSMGATISSSNPEPSKVVLNTSLRKYTGKGEGTAAAPSALTRLTNLLNHMKERRSQLVDEPQNRDTSITLASEGLLPRHPPETNSR
ncbi:rho GTPase-activating protein REN1-like isoform X3 [Magnolia sinica]|uniref:rho GTPase-activating protein REN1-like isoform X3 n=1 Tax=Magnolia sinica TaxID=86752 RepID=UPI00265B50E5|nr:rho GTPase-activating protein REN1-like isoform X3 [Magnolia sinica]